MGDFRTSGLKGQALNARTTNSHSWRSSLRGDFVISSISLGGRLGSVSLGARLDAPGPRALDIVGNQQKEKVWWVKLFWPKDFIDWCGFLHKQFSQTIVPVVKVSGLDNLETKLWRNRVKLAKTRTSHLVDLGCSSESGMGRTETSWFQLSPFGRSEFRNPNWVKVVPVWLKLAER
jgi:hypothetical protein